MKENYYLIKDIIQKKRDISGSILTYNTQFGNLKTQSGPYSNDILDSSGNILPVNTLKDAVRSDIRTILIQENTMYIVGVITTASLILTAILIAK
jgi:hypothetical protein